MKWLFPYQMFLVSFFTILNGMQTATAQNKSADSLLYKLMAKQAPLFERILEKNSSLAVQIIYTEIERGRKGKVHFTDHSFNLNDQQYFYPASTVKLPVAILALQKLNELKIAGLDKNTTMITGANGDRQTEVCNDPSAADGRPTIAHYIKKILLVSDNDAYNRLYEFLGQEYINTNLHKMGYTDVQIIHRLEISLTEEENRHTNPVQFIDSAGKLIYAKPAEKSKLLYANRNTKLGKGFLKAGELVNEPFDFSKKNRFPLTALHGVVKSILFPQAVPEKMRFNLTAADYLFLQKYMSMVPRESVNPVYDTAIYGDNYVKFLLHGAAPTAAQPGIRIFNKPGDAYGFLIDGAYIADYNSNIEFMVSAVIYCNSDEIFNDDKYEYKSIGLPFMKNLGQLLHQYERTKVRKKGVAFSPQIIHYTD